MKTKIIIFLAALLVLMAFSGYLMYEDYQFQKSEAKRQKHNVEVLNSDFTSYKVKINDTLTLNAAKINSLTYTLDEYKQFRANDARTIRDLNLKLKNVQSVTNIGTETKATIKTEIQYVDSTKCLNYQDQFNTISGCFNGDSINLTIETRDSLTTVVSRVPAHRFLWWTWGTKAIELTITAKNPGTKFEYLKYIEVKK